MTGLLAENVLDRPGRVPEGPVVFSAGYQGVGTRLDTGAILPLGTLMVATR